MRHFELHRRRFNVRAFLRDFFTAQAAPPCAWCGAELRTDACRVCGWHQAAIAPAHAPTFESGWLPFLGMPDDC